MTEAQPRPGEAGTGTGTGTVGSGQASGSAGPVTPARGGAVVDRAVPAHPACRIGVLVLAAAVAAAGSLALLGRAGASISSPPAGSADPARERGRERRHRRTTRPVGAGNTALRPR